MDGTFLPPSLIAENSRHWNFSRLVDARAFTRLSQKFPHWNNGKDTSKWIYPFVLVLSNVEDLIDKSWIMRNLIMYVCTYIHTIELFKWNNKIILNKEQVEFRFRELSALIVWICIPMCIHIFSFILLKCTIRNTGTSAFTDGLLILQLDWWQSSVQRCRVHDKNFICDGGWVVVLKFFQRGHLLSSDMNFELHFVLSRRAWNIAQKVKRMTKQLLLCITIADFN